MVTVSKYHVPSVGLILVGLLSILLAMQTFPHPFQQEYAHDVTQITESEIPDSTDVQMYPQLSSAGQGAVESALQANSTVTIYGVENQPQDFEYGDRIDSTYIKYEGRLYHLVTWDGDGIGILAELIFISMIGSGIGLLSLAVLSFKHPQPRFPLIVLVGVVSMVVVGLSDDYLHYQERALYLWSIPISGLVSGGLVWWLFNPYFE